MGGVALCALVMGVDGAGALAQVVEGDVAVAAGAHAEAETAVMVAEVAVCALVEADLAAMVYLVPDAIPVVPGATLVVLDATLVVLDAILVVLVAIPELPGIPYAAFREASHEVLGNLPTVHYEAHAQAWALSLQ